MSHGVVYKCTAPSMAIEAVPISNNAANYKTTSTTAQLWEFLLFAQMALLRVLNEDENESRA